MTEDVKKVSRRDQIVELIETGNYTKQEIADMIGIKASGVSSQLTYLRWMGKFIIFGEDKKLQFTDEDGFNAWEAAKKANRKTVSRSTRTPQEQFIALTKTIANQKKALATQKNKLAIMEGDDYEVTDDTLIPEAKANITLLEIKLDRNETKLATIDTSDFEEVEEEEVEEDELL